MTCTYTYLYNVGRYSLPEEDPAGDDVEVPGQVGQV